MRILALMALIGLGFAPATAEAGKKKKGGDDTEAAAESDDPYAKFAIEKTEVSDIDQVFDKAESPINTLIETRKMVDESQTSFTSALGVADGTSLEAAMKELEEKANGKIKLAMEGGKPSLATDDDIPEEAKAGADALQKTVDDMQSAMEKLGTVPTDLASLAEEAGGLAGNITSMGIPATKIPKVTKQVKQNVSALKAAKDEASMLADSLTGFQSALTSTFTADEGGDEGEAADEEGEAEEGEAEE